MSWRGGVSGGREAESTQWGEGPPQSACVGWGSHASQGRGEHPPVSGGVPQGSVAGYSVDPPSVAVVWVWGQCVCVVSVCGCGGSGPHSRRGARAGAGQGCPPTAAGAGGTWGARPGLPRARCDTGPGPAGDGHQPEGSWLPPGHGTSLHSQYFGIFQYHISASVPYPSSTLSSPFPARRKQMERIPRGVGWFDIPQLKPVPKLAENSCFFFLAAFFSPLPLSLPFPLFPRELGTPARLCRHLGGPGGAVSFVPAAVWLPWGWCVCDPALVLAPAAGAGECGRRFGFVGGGLRGLGGGCELRGCSRRGTLGGARLSPAVGHRGDRALRAPALPAGPRSRRTDRWTPQPRRTPRPALHGRRQPCPGPAEDGVSPGRRRSRPLSDSDPPSLRARPPPASPPS